MVVSGGSLIMKEQESLPEKVQGSSNRVVNQLIEKAWELLFLTSLLSLVLFCGTGQAS